MISRVEKVKKTSANAVPRLEVYVSNLTPSPLPIIEHFSMLDDSEAAQEDLVASLLAVIGYSAQSLELGRNKEQIIKHLRSEQQRIQIKYKCAYMRLGFGGS